MTIDQYKRTPFGSNLLLPPEQREELLEAFFILPPAVKQMVISFKTAAYLQGAMRSYDLPDDQTPKLSLIVFRVALGLKPLGQLPVLISSELGVPNDRAQALATEIERDLFAPIMMEYNNYVTARKAAPTKSAAASGAPNVLNLKNKLTALPPNVPRPLTVTTPPPPPPLPPLRR